MKSRLTLIVLFACLVIPRPQLAQQQDSPSAYQKAISFALKRQYELAEQSFLEALKEDSTRVDSQYGLARLHAETGHWEKAETRIVSFPFRPASLRGWFLFAGVRPLPARSVSRCRSGFARGAADQERLCRST